MSRDTVAVTPELSPSALSKAPDAPLRLIVVDDEPVILELLATVFADEPYDVISCANGISAVAAMNEGGVDVLLTDKNLPDINGLQLIEHARRLVPDSEAIIITGYASLDTALEAMALEVFDYIIKPPKDIFEVRRKVRMAFDRQRMRRENDRLVSALRATNAELTTALQETRSLQADLIQSEKLAGIGTLAAGIAHEIASPLFGIMGLAEAVADEDDLGTVREYAVEIVDYSRSIKDIIGELSGYSRTAEREYLASISLAGVVHDAARLVTRTMGIAPEVVCCTIDGDVSLSARPSELQQVFVNLIKNAVQAVSAQPASHICRVQVAGGRDRNGIWATVIDNGPGIGPDAQKVIFDPFYTTKPPGQGTGLGLNIVYRIVTKYRGSVSVESELGEGTTFRLRFPVGP